MSYTKNKKMKLVPLLFYCLFFMGCSSSHYNSVVSSDTHAYILVKGNLKGKTLYINKSMVNLDKSKKFNLNGVKAAKFPVNEGDILIKITEGDNILVHKKTFIFNGQTYEVHIQWKSIQYY